MKLSGEALSGDKGHGFDDETCLGVAAQVRRLTERGIEVAIVIGGGNFWRGRTSESMDRVRADQIGMLATVMNCLYVSDAFRRTGMDTCIMTPFVCGSFASLYDRDSAVKALEEGKVVFFAGGTGNPYFSTDTATSLRAIEIQADVIMLAKAVDGIYDSDPKIHPEAKRYERISIQEVIDKRLAAMDLSASIMCMENHMPMFVFALAGEDSILHAIEQDGVGTWVSVD